jgi:hypothetical protein
MVHIAVSESPVFRTGLFELAKKLKLKYILVSVETVWETGSLFSLTFAVLRFVGIMGTSFAVVFEK